MEKGLSLVLEDKTGLTEAEATEEFEIPEAGEESEILGAVKGFKMSRAGQECELSNVGERSGPCS